VQVGTSKTKGCTVSLQAAVRPGALVTGNRQTDKQTKKGAIDNGLTFHRKQKIHTFSVWMCP
jgi:hypothetical protein